MAQDVILRLVRADGAELVLDESDWGITALTGIDATEYELFTQDRGSGDGAVVTGRRAAARDIECAAQVMDPGDSDVLRWQAVAFFRPASTYAIYVTFRGRTRWITGYLTAFRCPAAQLELPQTMQFNLTCPDPWFCSTDDFGRDIAGETACWAFPYQESGSGLPVSVYDFDSSVHLAYDGDIATGFVATLRADDDVVNPTLRLGTGAYVRLLDTLHAGDEVVLDFDQAGVTKNGVNAIAKVDRRSSFTSMHLEIGDNLVQYTADSGENDLHVVLRYYKRYLGV